MSCLFCDIVAGRRDASRVWEDESCVAFMDLYPVRPGHVLIVPRHHAVLLTELDATDRARLFALGADIRAATAAIGLGTDGANLMLNDGVAANQHIRHVHLHVLPRERGDGFAVWGRFATRMLNVFGQSARRRELDELAGRLRAAMGDGPGPPRGD